MSNPNVKWNDIQIKHEGTGSVYAAVCTVTACIIIVGYKFCKTDILAHGVPQTIRNDWNDFKRPI